MRRTINAIAAVAALAIAPAHANVTISSDATKNMTCSNGVCAPTAKNAVLNIIDLENDLAAGNLTVTTTGSGGVQANDIAIDAALSWAESNALALNAYHSVRVGKPVAVTGGGGLTILTNNGGAGGFFGFAEGANVAFSNLSSDLTIDGGAYMLVDSVASLARAIASNPGGNYALAGNYDASGDGTYQDSPIPTEFSGNFEGLGNTISHLSLKGSGDIYANVGLFAEIALNNGPGGAIENIALQNLRVDGKGFAIGGLVGNNEGTISGAFASGIVSSNYRQSVPGLLVAVNGGTVTRSGVAGSISTAKPEGGGGGLVADNFGVISESYADCTISMKGGPEVGGLVGGNKGSISESYAFGLVGGGNNSERGGLVGENDEGSTITQSYSITTLREVGHRNHQADGLIGVDESQAGSNMSDYWDVSTSHVRGRSKGAGTPRDDPGITGLTTQQLQSGLPAGFDPSVWAEDPKINNGLPYLIDNPPRN